MFFHALYKEILFTTNKLCQKVWHPGLGNTRDFRWTPYFWSLTNFIFLIVVDVVFSSLFITCTIPVCNTNFKTKLNTYTYTYTRTFIYTWHTFYIKVSTQTPFTFWWRGTWGTDGPKPQFLTIVRSNKMTWFFIQKFLGALLHCGF